MMRRLLLLSLLFSLTGWAALPPVHPDRGEAAYRRAVLRVRTDLRLLCFAAHPDDEDGATLAYYALSRGIHTFTALANWGEGGQNEVGPELYDDLALLRAQETEAAGQLLGTDQLYCMNLADFGYSKTLEETLEKWGREQALQQMIIVIRTVRPDVIITNHREGEGHGNHQAIAALLLPAVQGAADPVKYPELSMRGLAAWKVARVFVHKNLPYGAPNEQYDVAVPVGAFDALRGATYQEIAGAALQEHKSQGRWTMADTLLPEATFTYFTEIYPAGEKVKADLFEGIPDGFAPARGYYGIYDASESITPEAFAAFNQPLARAVGSMATSREETGKALAEANNFLSRLPQLSNLTPRVRSQSESARTLQRFNTNYLYQRGQDVANALWECAGLSAVLSSDDDTLCEGQTFSTSVALTNTGAGEVEGATAHMLLPYQWKSESTWQSPPAAGGMPGDVSPGATVRIRFSNQVFSEVESQPPAKRLKADIAPPRPPLKAVVSARAFGTDFSRIIQNPGRIVPELDIAFNQSAFNWVRPATGSRPVEFFVEARNNSSQPCTGRMFFMLPSPLKAMAHQLFPPTREYALDPGQSRVWSVVGDISSETPTGRFSLFAYAEGSPRHNAVSEVKAAVLDAALPENLSVGIFRSYDRTLFQALGNLGARVVDLDGDQLPFLDLRGLDSIVVDMRAYLVHPQLAQYNSLLLDYARGGGNLVVMYQKTEEWESSLAPYPLQIGRQRVTVETAPVQLLAPGHPLLSWPNVLDASAWAGWIQERGLYFPRQADTRYTRLVSMADPGEPLLDTGWLVAEVGKGSYIYTSLVWYRQLREGHPGAYRALANMVAYPRRPRR